MLKLFAKTFAALSMMMTVSAGTPAWSAGKPGAASAECPDAQRKLTKRAPAPQPVRSVMVVDKRKLDVQILSFGP